MTGRTSLARTIVHALGGDWSGNGGLVSGLGHSAWDRSISIKNHPTNPNDVLVHSFGRDDALAFKHTLRDRGLLPQRVDGFEQPRSPSWPTRPKPTVNLTEDQVRRQVLARRLWDVTQPITSGTAAAAYLTTARALPGPWPASLRFHSRCPRGKDEPPLPALVAAVTVPTTGEFRAVHRVYLRADGLAKADLPRERQRMSLGRTSSAAVVLGDLADGDGPILEGEGIETTLTVIQAMGLPGIATLSISSLGRPPLPPGRPVIILADRGGEGGAAKAALMRTAEGRAVRIALPPEGKKDFNDIVRGA